jgi:hypothetical protein
MTTSVTRARVRSVMMRGTDARARWWRKAAAIAGHHRRAMNDRGQSRRLLWIMVWRSNNAADLGKVIDRTPGLVKVAVDPVDRDGRHLRRAGGGSPVHLGSPTNRIPAIQLACALVFRQLSGPACSAAFRMGDVVASIRPLETLSAGGLSPITFQFPSWKGSENSDVSTNDHAIACSVTETEITIRRATYTCRSCMQP